MSLTIVTVPVDIVNLFRVYLGLMASRICQNNVTNSLIITSQIEFTNHQTFFLYLLGLV